MAVYINVAAYFANEATVPYFAPQKWIAFAKPHHRPCSMLAMVRKVTLPVQTLT
jgi:hypothetical protein